jgi:hypothetical protein
MIWQDVVLFVGTICFGLSLAPTLSAPEKPPLITSGGTAIILFVFSATMITIPLYATAVLQSILGIMWSVLFFQKWKIRKR